MLGDVIEVFTWVKECRRGDINKVLIVNGQVKTQSKGFKSDVFRFKKEICRNCFTNKVVDEWNRLSSPVVSVNAIESKMRKETVEDDDR